MKDGVMCIVYMFVYGGWFIQGEGQQGWLEKQKSKKEAEEKNKKKGRRKKREKKKEREKSERRKESKKEEQLKIKAMNSLIGGCSVQIQYPLKGIEVKEGEGPVVTDCC
jgi:hypothetical protein